MKNLTINDSNEYESNTLITSYAQGHTKRNPETVTHTSNGDFEQKILSYWTIPVLPLTRNLGMDLRLPEIRLTPQMLLTTAMKEIFMEAALGGAWTSRTPQKSTSTGVDGKNIGDIGNAIVIVEPLSPVMIGIIGSSLT